MPRVWFQSDPTVETIDDGQNFYLYLLIALILVGLAMINRRVARARRERPRLRGK